MLIQQRIEEVDQEHLWERHLPSVAATEQELAETEARLGFALDPSYRGFLRYADGWKCMWHFVDLFGTRQLLGESPMDSARRQLGAVTDEEFTHPVGVSKEGVLPIGASAVQSDMFLLCQPWSQSPGQVLWYTGQLIDRFESFREFYLSMFDYNREEVRDLENEARSQ